MVPILRKGEKNYSDCGDTFRLCRRSLPVITASTNARKSLHALYLDEQQARSQLEAHFWNKSICLSYEAANHTMYEEASVWFVVRLLISKSSPSH